MGMASINMKIMDGAAGLLGFDISSGKKALLSDLKNENSFSPIVVNP